MKKAQAEANTRLRKEIVNKYEINVNVDKIVLLIEVNENSYLYGSIDRIILEHKGINHVGEIQNINIAYSQMVGKNSQKNTILNDFTIGA